MVVCLQYSSPIVGDLMSINTSYQIKDGMESDNRTRLLFHVVTSTKMVGRYAHGKFTYERNQMIIHINR